MGTRELTFGIVALLLAASHSTGFAEPDRPAALRGMYNVVEMGAKGDGKTDDTAAFQRALDAAAGDGGGLVTAPTGTYLIETHLAIPQNVSLEGVWRSPQRGDPVTAGTTLLAVEGQGQVEGPPFIALGTSATLRGVTIYYPEQIRANPPHAYPWTIATTGPTDNCAIIDVTIINPYQAVDFGTHPTGRHFISRLYGYPLFKGLYINQCYDVGRIENIHFWPFWDLDPNSPLWVFTKENATAFIIGKTDGQMAHNLFTIFYKVGMHFIRGPIYDEDGVVRRTSPGSGVYTNCYMDITPCAVKVDDVQAHAGISFVNGMFMTGIEVGAKNKGQVKFTGCGFWPNRGQTYHAKVEGRGAVMFESCHFSGWDQLEDGTPCIDANSRRLIVTGCEFNTERTDHLTVRLGPGVHAAVITSNLMPGGVNIENNAPRNASVQIGLNAGAFGPAFVRDWLVVGPFPNPRVREPAQGAPTRAGFDTDYLEALGGEAKALLTPDATVSFRDDKGGKKTAKTRAVQAVANGAVDLKRAYETGGGVAYAFCYIRSERDQTATFHLGANDCSKAWVNGTQVHAYWDENGGDSAPGAYRFEAPLHAGLNPLLVKVEDAGGRRWEFILEAYGADGNALTAVLSPE